MKKKPRNGPGCRRDLKKLVIMMKLTCLLTCCLVQAVASDAQSRRKVTMHLERATIKEVLAEYQRQTGTIVVYSSDKLETSREVRARFKAVDEEVFFDAVLAGSNMSYKIQDDYILIVPAPATPQEQEVARGRVTNAAGEPLAGVTIRVKGTDRGGITDKDGLFRVALPPGEARALQFSFVGMKPVEVAYRGQEEILVTLEDAEVEIEEVVVTGVFTRRANSYTGAIASVKGDELRRVG
ncbi:MAG: carboxypeptidase-like regulatory domain-containing protein, partial [Odoribacteraceae bacterium]|nr:carboxypeptidase-like regulatory domain-containing protein [Odoribacteraceae bacterium]